MQRWLLILTSLSLWIAANAAQAQLHVVIVERTDPAVDPVTLPASEGATFSGMGTPAIGAEGTVAFPATITGVPINTTNTLWASAPAADERALRLVAREGDAAPGTPAGVLFNAFDDPSVVVGRDGRVAFSATLRGTGVTSSNVRGIWFETSSGVLELVIRQGDGLLTDIGDFAFTSTTDDEFIAVAGDDGADTVLLGGDPQSLTLVARTGDPVPLLDCDYDVLSRPSLNRFGQVAFRATLDPDQGSDPCLDTIFRWLPGDIPLVVVRLGDPVPGFPVDTSVSPNEPSTFRTFGSTTNQPKISDDAKVLFKVEVDVRDGTGASDVEDTLWVGVPGGPLDLVAVTGQTAKNGTVTIDAVNDAKWAISAGGNVAATVGTDENTTPQELFVGPPLVSPSFTQIGSYGETSLDLIAELFGPTPDGSTTHTKVDGPLMNTPGQVAFTGATSTSSKTLWLVEPDGNGVLVAATSEDLLLDGVLRPVTTLNDVTLAGGSLSSGTTDGLATQISDNGQVVFTVGLLMPTRPAIVVYPEIASVPLSPVVPWVTAPLLLVVAHAARTRRRRTP